MEVFAYLLALVWSILCLILFFKIWGMTNNVEQLTREVHELKMTIVQERQERPQTQSQKIVLEKEEQEKEEKVSAKSIKTVIDEKAAAAKNTVAETVDAEE